MKKLKGLYEKEGIWPTSNLHKRILSFIEEKNGNALDVGCGTGNLAEELIKKGYRVVGADMKNFMRNKKINFKKIDLDEKWNLKKDFFDLITATEVIEHLENPRHFIRELKKSLKKEGVAIITTPNIFNWKARLYYLMRGVIWGFREFDYIDSGHITPVTIYDIERICKEEKLKIIKKTYSNSNKKIFGESLIVIIKK